MLGKTCKKNHACIYIRSIYYIIIHLQLKEILKDEYPNEENLIRQIVLLSKAQHEQIREKGDLETNYLIGPFRDVIVRMFDSGKDIAKQMHLALLSRTDQGESTIMSILWHRSRGSITKIMEAYKGMYTELKDDIELLARKNIERSVVTKEILLGILDSKYNQKGNPIFCSKWTVNALQKCTKDNYVATIQHLCCLNSSQLKEVCGKYRQLPEKKHNNIANIITQKFEKTVDCSVYRWLEEKSGEDMNVLDVIHENEVLSAEQQINVKTLIRDNTQGSFRKLLWAVCVGEKYPQ